MTRKHKAKKVSRGRWLMSDLPLDSGHVRPPPTWRVTSTTSLAAIGWRRRGCAGTTRRGFLVYGRSGLGQSAIVESWSRGTRVFRRRDGDWTIVHQHVSYPYDPAPKKRPPTFVRGKRSDRQTAHHDSAVNLAQRRHRSSASLVKMGFDFQ